VDPDAHDVSGLHGACIEPLQGFIDDPRRAKAIRRGRRQHVQPPWRNHGRAERQVAGIDYMYAHASTSERAGDLFAETAEEACGCDTCALRGATNGDSGIGGR
jgi:hypothetical protein